MQEVLHQVQILQQWELPQQVVGMVLTILILLLLVAQVAVVVII